MSLTPKTFEEDQERAARYSQNRRAKLAEKGSKGRFGGISRSKAISRLDPLYGGKAIPEGQNATPTKPRRGKKGFRAVTRDRADHFFSLYVRYRDKWTCQRCRKPYEVGSQGLHNSHHFGRARENTRFDPINCDALCHGCHAFFTANPADHYAWKLARIEQAEYDKLTIRANTRCKKDRKLMAMVCREMYEKEKARFELDNS